jgi:hypothetical protein
MLLCVFQECRICCFVVISVLAVSDWAVARRCSSARTQMLAVFSVVNKRSCSGDNTRSLASRLDSTAARGSRAPLAGWIQGRLDLKHSRRKSHVTVPYSPRTIPPHALQQCHSLPAPPQSARPRVSISAAHKTHNPPLYKRASTRRKASWNLFANCAT